MAGEPPGPREFWTRQMEQAYRFMQAVLEYPVEECGEPFHNLPEAFESAGVEVEFSQRPHVRGLPRLFVMRGSLVEDLVAVARDMNQRGWVLVVEDIFRTRQMQKHLAHTDEIFDRILQRVMWERGGAAPGPEFMARRVAALVAYAPKVGTHMSGSAIDLSVRLRDNGNLLDRGGPYLEMSERTPMDSPFISPQARENRAAVTALMRRHGFVEYPWEFWHYSKGDAYDEHLRDTGRPARYGPVDWDPVTNRLTPIARPWEPLNSPQEIQARIDAALARLRGN